LALAAAVIGVGIGLGIWLWPRTPPPLQPPTPDLSEVDPEVAEAIAAAQDKIRQQPTKSALWGRLGMIFFAHDMHEEAQRSFEQAERLDPADGRWPYLRGLSLILTQPNAGIPCLQRAAENCGKEPLAPRLRLAETLLTQNRLDEAAFHLEWARKVDPHDPRVQLDLGRLALLRGQWRRALEILNPCTNDVHTRRMAHTLLAEAWTRLGEADKAHEEQRQVAEAPEDQHWSDPFVEEVLSLQCGLAVHLRQAHELSGQGRYREAVELLKKTAGRYPKSPAIWLLLGDIWRQLGRKDRSEEAFAAAVRIDPESVDGWFRLGCMQAELDQPRAAADSFRRAIRLKADHTDAHLNLGHCLKKMGDTAGAAEAFRGALRCRPDYERAKQALRELEKKQK
jgi:tetratricopeptide (TPR) repeat protein